MSTTFNPRGAAVREAAVSLGIRANGVAILALVANFGTCWAGTAFIAEKVGCCQRTVFRWFERLRSDKGGVGLIERERGDRRNPPTQAKEREKLKNQGFSLTRVVGALAILTGPISARMQARHLDNLRRGKAPVPTGPRYSVQPRKVERAEPPRPPRAPQEFKREPDTAPTAGVPPEAWAAIGSRPPPE